MQSRFKLESDTRSLILGNWQSKHQKHDSEILQTGIHSAMALCKYRTLTAQPGRSDDSLLIAESRRSLSIFISR